MTKINSIRLNMFFLSIEKIFNGSITILLLPVIIRIIGIEQYGLWAVFLGIFSYMQCMDLGVSFSLERHIAFYQGSNDKDTLQKLITTSLTYMIALSTLLLLFCLFAGDFILQLLVKNNKDALYQNMLLFCFPAIAANFFQAVFMSIPRGLQKFDISSKIQVAGKVVFTIALLSTIFRLKSVLSPLFAYTMQTIFTTVAYAIAAKTIAPDIRFLRLGISKPHFKKLIGFGINIQVSSFAFLITQHFDKMLLSSFFGLAYAGYYETATRIIYALRDIPLFLMSVLTPHISRQLSLNNTAVIVQLYKRITSQLSIVSFFLMGLLITNQQQLLTLVLKSPPNSFTLLVFNLLAIAGFWHVISGGSTYVSRGMGKTTVEMKTNILTLSLNISFSLLFMHFFSYKGIVYGTAIAMIASPFLSYFLTNNLFSISTPRFLISSFSLPLLLSTFPLSATFFLNKIIAQHLSPVVTFFCTSALLLVCTHIIYTLTGNKAYHELVALIPVGRKKG